ncbi:hypothetical protein SAMN02745166_02783 [Prosthecobacter debontii]|uniref:Uncharacterized protein n=1 Tax=Prosthecobacter debontii TaxID=48467 RepID=A0A1T4Y9N9_9BACT|nr:hypothetical protein [Prosthecobacter debontii]SKA98527.1 hypothetical protein SAMN02745166_02783 [Prosthecobacter debontii]
MAKESPLFQSSLELFAHAIEHFNGGAELDRKLAILHLANSVELIFKDLLLDLDVSIFKGAKETISIHGAIKELKDKNVPLPYLNKVELLIDERNALQHRYGSPNELTTIFYMESTYEFMKSLLQAQYDLDLDEVLPQFTNAADIEAFRLRKPREEKELEGLKKVSKVHPLGAFLAAYNYLDTVIRKFSSEVSQGRDRMMMMSSRPVSLRTVERYGIEVPNDLSEKVDDLRQMRNHVAHGRTEASRADVETAIKVAEAVEKFLSEQDIEKASHLYDEYERKRQSEQPRFYGGGEVVYRPSQKKTIGEQDGAGQPASHSESDSEGGNNPQHIAP